MAILGLTTKCTQETYAELIIPLSVPVDNVPAARGEVQPHPCFMLNIPSEASAEGSSVSATGTGGNGPQITAS